MYVFICIDIYIYIYIYIHVSTYTYTRIQKWPILCPRNLEHRIGPLSYIYI